jgi:electron transport complex protein RnfA
MSFVQIITLVVAGVITDNVVLSQSLGICPFLGVSKKTDSAFGMGFAVTLVMLLSSSVCYLLYHYLLEPLAIEYLRTVAFILIIAVLVQVLDIVLKKISPALYGSLGVYLALITTNCAVLGTANLVIDNGYNLIETMIESVSVGLGFTLALLLMSAIRERVETSENIPVSFKGLPIALIIAALMAMAFYGFSGFAI